MLGPSALSDLTFRAPLQQQEIVKLRNHLLTLPQSNWDDLYSHIVNDHVRCRENGISELRDNCGVVGKDAVERILNTMFLRYPSPSFIEDFGDRLPWNFFVSFDVDVKAAKDEVASSKIGVRYVRYSEPYYITAAKIIVAKAKDKVETKTSYTKGSWRAEIMRLTTEKLISEFSLIRPLSHLVADYIWAVETDKSETTKIIQ